MSYSDMINAVNQYGTGMQGYYANTANNLNNVKFNTGPVNPNSSGAFTPQTARDIYSSSTNVHNPMAAFSDYKPYSGENLMMQGMKGVQYAGIAGEVSPYVKDFASSLAKPGTTFGYGTGKGPNFALPAAVYGLTQNQNPYDYTQTEAMGSTASNMMMAHQLSTMLPASSFLASGAGATAASLAAGAGTGAATLGATTGATGALAGINPYVMLAALAFSWFRNKKKKRKAKANVEKVRTEIKDKQDEIYTSREDKVRQGRQDMLSQQTTDLYNQREGRYDNQYGGAYAEEGMKMDENIVAEFTGNELIVNDQDKVEKGLDSGNYAMAAAPIKRAMKNKQLTPGPETHQGNPMSVDTEGNIYVHGGKLPFKANKGAGIYDHATDQFKPTMTDKEIAMVAQENINKWESNGMA